MPTTADPKELGKSNIAAMRALGRR
jgi:hypothetical protein